MTRARGKRIVAERRQAREIGAAARRAGLTIERALNYYAHDAERYPPDDIASGWREQDGIYARQKQEAAS